MSIEITKDSPRRVALGWRVKAGSNSTAQSAIHDLIEGVRRWYLWSYLGWQDIRQRYRRSIIGPLWLTLSMGIVIGSLGFVYSNLLGQDISHYLPYLAAGFIFWGFLSTTIGECASCFILSEGTIKQVPMPLSVHILRTLARNFIIMLHNLAIWLVIVVIFPVDVNANILLILPGLALVSINLFCIGLMLAMICARFRDVGQIVTNVLQLAFFVTPIMWKPGFMLHGSLVLVNYNPFHHLLSIMREPLLGIVPDIKSYIFIVAMTCATMGLAVFAFVRYRRYIPYWL